MTIAFGEDHCILQLSETNGQVEGTYSGILGQDKPVKGTYKHQKLSLSFSGDWPTDGTPAQVTLDGSISGDSGSGDVVIVDRADGTWTAHRAKQADVLPAADGTASVQTAGSQAANPDLFGDWQAVPGAGQNRRTGNRSKRSNQ